jgi:hypothetical protein
MLEDKSVDLVLLRQPVEERQPGWDNLPVALGCSPPGTTIAILTARPVLASNTEVYS